jgi:hypothetical protein
LYKCVDYKVIDWPYRDLFKEHITPKAIVDATNARNPAWEGSQALQENDVRVDFSTMHYGMKERNPLDFVRFYSKRSLNGKLSMLPCSGIPFIFFTPFLCG